MRNRRFGLVQSMCVVILASMLVASVEAQQERRRRDRGRQGRRGGFFGRGMRGMASLFYLTNPQVQEELKMTDDQKASLEGLREAQGGLFRGLRDLTEEERQKKFQDLAKQSKETVEKTLNKMQQARLRQIELQQTSRRGLAGVLLGEEVVKGLKITEEQKKKVSEITEETAAAREDLTAAVEEGLIDRTELRGMIRELGSKETEDVMAVLNETQKEQWTAMLGKPFEMSFRGFGRRGGRGGRGGRRGGDRPDRPSRPDRQPDA